MSETLKVRLSVTDMPKVIAGLRSELAGLLREVADRQILQTAVALREVADIFEKGMV